MFIVPIDSDDSVPCASCESNWSVPVLADLQARQRLRAEGFAFLWFDDGAIAINYCPHCERPAELPMYREVPSWPISPLFP
jgi:hypothetical protein